MIKLMKLELQRVNLRTYLIADLALGCFILLFTYFVANVAQIEQVTEFMNYGNIYQFSCVIGLLLFGTLSAVMSNNLVIKEYSGKRLALLFSYPVSRRKIFMGKVWIILLFSFLSTLFCTSIPIAIFSLTETVLPIVSDTISADLLTETVQMIIFSALSVSTAGLLAMGMGFIRKSITVTLISVIFFLCIYGNIAIGTSGHIPAMLSVVGVSLISVTVVLILLSNKINQMEAK